MDLIKNGKLLQNLRKSKGLTQKQLADKLGVVAKTISKWETGHGFPDVAIISSLADVLEVSERSLLHGDIIENKKSVRNVKRTKFFVCSNCGSLFSGIGESQIICCGKTLKPLKVEKADNNHNISVSEIDNEYYIESNHEMSKEHHIKFIIFIGFDRTLTIHLYPEQTLSVHIPKMQKGKLYAYCSIHGLFEFNI